MKLRFGLELPKISHAQRRVFLRYLAYFFGLSFAWANADTAPAVRPLVYSLKVTILDTPVAGSGIGEWGFSALVEADGHQILYDTGGRSDIVLKNAKMLKIDLTAIPDVVLSHNHPDHVGGLMALRQSVLTKFPGALARTHVGDGIFGPRTTFNPGIIVNSALLLKPEYEKTGGVFVVHREPVELYPGIWLTGPVPRKFEPYGGAGPQTTAAAGYDTIPEDMALICNTDKGLVIIEGCGHAGIVNIVAYAQAIIRPARIYALIGGLHLNDATDDTVSWTTEKLRSYQVDNLLGAHCTGFETVYRFRKDLGLDRAHAAVAVIGSSFDLANGINPWPIAQ